ncbi:MAG: CAP domain-containing protein [Pseudomonadota bacterium]|nr:CAP domain-containing protein [Pseudomonadota bacterium]
MSHFSRLAGWSGACALSVLMAACGGGGGGSDNGTPAAAAPVNSTAPLQAPGYAVAAPAPSNNTAADGFADFNYRRQQMGLPVVSRNGNIDVAAQGHSNYQNVNDTITHTQTAGKPAFTGVSVLDRLTAAQYVFNPSNGYAYGEVIAASGDLSGVNNAEDLITAIYHRFVIFEPKFREAGAGSVGFSATGYNYFTVDFAANGLSGGIGAGQVGLYPFPNETGIVPIFRNHQESPDPVPSQDGVGYPVSVHADIDTTLTVSQFTITPRGGQPLQTKLLSHATDTETPASAAAIVPLTVLGAATTYDVQFVGTVSGLPVTRNWSFTTR